MNHACMYVDMQGKSNSRWSLQAYSVWQPVSYVSQRKTRTQGSEIHCQVSFIAGQINMTANHQPLPMFASLIIFTILPSTMVLSHDQCNIRLKNGASELVWISYRLERGFHWSNPKGFTCTIKKVYGIKVRTGARVRSMQAPTHCHQCQSSLGLRPHEDWPWCRLVGACVDLPLALVLTIISISQHVTQDISRLNPHFTLRHLCGIKY